MDCVAAATGSERLPIQQEETMPEVKVNAVFAKKVLSIVDAGLVAGVGDPEPGRP